MSERCVDCGSERVTDYGFWHGGFLPLCRRCFARFVRRRGEP
jgi:hypothetical protein